MAIWNVENTNNVKKKLYKDFKNGKLTNEDVILIKKWVSDMENYGPQYISNTPRWDDHSLVNEWEGYRASCFSNRGRIIYKIFDKKILVVVVRITTAHDYQRDNFYE